MAYNFQTGSNKIKLLKESVTQKLLFGNAVLTALMYGRNYDVIPQNGDCLRESNMLALVLQDNVLYKNAASLQSPVWRRSTSR
jgi:hypothetical protein